MNDYDKIKDFIKRRFIFIVLTIIVLWLGVGVSSNLEDYNKQMNNSERETERFNAEMRK